MHSIGRLAALVGSLLLVLVASRAHAQVYGERLAGLYEFRDLVADLRAAEVHPPPEALVEAYRNAVERWLRDQTELRTSLERVTGSDVRVHVGKADMERAVAVLRRSRAVATAAEDGLFNRLAEMVPPEEAPKLAMVRQWRQIERANPGSVGIAFVEFKDVSRAVRQIAMPDDARRAALLALESSSGARRDALARLQRSTEDAIVAGGAVIDAMGVAGQVVEDPSDMQPFWNATHPTAESLADAYDVELKALEVASAVLPPAQRRAVFNDVTRGLLADQMRGSGIGLPATALGPQSPSDFARILLSWKDLDPSKRAATRKALSNWLDEDEASLRAGLEARARSLHEGGSTSLSLPTEIQRARRTIAERHIPIVAEASGATWMTDAPNSKPICDESTLKDADFALTGTIVTRAPPPPEAEVHGLVSQLLPMPFDSEWRDRVVTALIADDPSVRDVVDQLLKDHAAEWADRVEPLINAAQVADARSRPYRPTDDHGAELSAAEIARAIVDADTARRAAYEMAATVDDAFFDALHAGLGEASAPTITALRAARGIQQETGPYGQTSRRVVSPGFDRFGGHPVNLALVLFDPSVPTPVQRAAANAASEHWQPLQSRAGTTLRAALAYEYHERVRRHRLLFDEAGVDVPAPALAPDDDPGFASLDQAALINAWGALVDRAREEDDALQALLLDAAAEDATGREALRVAIQRTRLPIAYSTVAQIEGLVDGARQLPEFDGRDAVIAQVLGVSDAMATIAQRRAELWSQRVSCVGLSDDELWAAVGSRGWRELDIVRAGFSLCASAAWLLNERVPEAILAKSPDLKRSIQLWAHLY